MRTILNLLVSLIPLATAAAATATAPAPEPAPAAAPTPALAPAPARVAEDDAPSVAAPWDWQRQLVLDDAALDSVRSLTWLPARAERPAALCVGGRKQAVWLDGAGVRTHEVAFEPRMTSPRPVDLDADGEHEYMNTGGGWSPVGLRDSSGAPLWTYPGIDVPGFFDAAPNAMAAGDLDGDGALEFVIGLNGGGGVLVVDQSGELLQTFDASNVFAVGLLDVDGDDDLDIVHGDNGELVARNGDGRELYTPLPDFHSFSMVTDRDGEPLLGCIQDGQVLLAGPGSRVVERFPVADAGHKDIELAWLRRADGAHYVAISRTLGARSARSELYVFDDARELVHHEEFAAAHVAIAAVPDADGETDSLYVGAGTQVWRYGPGPVSP